MAASGEPARNIRVGVIGGGQLAWMMAAAAEYLGIDLWVQTPKPDDPAVAIAAQTLLAPITDIATTARLAKQCDVITFENEFIDLAGLRSLSLDCFYPQLDCLAPLLDKYDQRQYCQKIGLPTPPFVALDGKADLPELAARIAAVGLPLVLKTRRHGYDGQGTFILKDADAVASTWQQLGYPPVMLEAFVPFEQELAVMAARSRSGEVRVYPVVETQQVNQVCQRVIAPAAVTVTVAQQVEQIATRLLSTLGVVGLFGIELFLTAEQQVLINEIAPRTHNSGHYTLDACETSQFEQQLRAVCGLPLGSVEMTWAEAVMVNLLGYETATGDYAEQRSAIAALPNAHVYWYGKTQSRPGRKLGHVTLVTDRAQPRTDIDALIQRVESLWYPTPA